MRHEWKNQVSVLHLLRQTGNPGGLDRQLEHRLNQMTPKQYFSNVEINTILQSNGMDPSSWPVMSFYR